MIKEHGGNVYKVSRETGLDISEILDFSANINPLGIPQSGQRAIVDAIEGLRNYPDPDYWRFKEALGAHHGLASEWIVPGNGAIDSLYSAVAAVRPERVLVSVPSFVEYERAINKAGAQYLPVYRKPEHGYGFDVESFIDRIDETIDLAIICNPNNPTGDLIDKSDVMRILSACRSHGAYLLLDEAFMEFAEVFGAESALDYAGNFDNLIVSRSLTKFFAVPGLRAGYLVVADPIIRARLADDAEPWKLNHLADAFAQAVVKDRGYMEETREWLQSENSYLYKALSEIEGLIVRKSWANYIFFEMQGTLDLKQAMLNHGLMIRACGNYDGITGNCYRVAVKDRASNEKLVNALQRVSAIGE